MRSGTGRKLPAGPLLFAHSRQHFANSMASYGRPINGPSDVLLDHGEGRTAALSFRSTPNPRPRFECRCGRRCATGEGRPPVAGLASNAFAAGSVGGAESRRLLIVDVPVLF